MHPKRKKNPNAKRPKLPRKDFDRLVADAWKAGWWCYRSGKNYVICQAPENGWTVRVPSTASSQATLRNLKAKFRRYGLDV